MNKKSTLVAALVFAVSVAQADSSQVENDIGLLARKRSIAIAASRLPIEQAYLNELKRAIPKAEATKDLDLQLKLRKEIAIVEKNIEYFSAKRAERVDSYSTKRIFGVTWKSRQGYFVKFDDKTKRFYNTWHEKGDPMRIEGNRFYILEDSFYYEYDADRDVITSSNFNNDGILFYRDGKFPKEDPKEAPKAPEGEEVNTLFGVRSRK